MTAPGLTLFETPLGHCGIAWTGRGIAGVQLPERSVAQTRLKLAERFPEFAERRIAPPARAARDGIVDLLSGGAPRLTDIDLDMSAVTPFRQRVYGAARAIPRGRTSTYGELAAQLGQPGAARAIGQALGSNPFPIIVPCHRILAAGGRSGGFTAEGGVSTKLRMLALEGTGAVPAVAGEGGFGFDLAAAVAQLRASDKTLARTIAAVGPCRMSLKPTATTFAALAEAIVYQQLNGRAAATIFGRVCALFPRSRGGPKAAQILAVDDSSLRGAGLSRAKMLALQDLARRTIAGEIPTIAALATMDDEAIVESLVPVRGIGRWTVEMLLMFRLGRPDILPVDDYGVRQGYALAFRKRGLPTRQELLRHGERWRPFRSVASWYLWRAVELARE